MYIIPAIDLLGGKCVRLIQGEYHRQITYKDDPSEQATEFIAAGVEWLHVIDLDGAKLGKPVNTDRISEIVSVGGLKIEVGGGIREESSIRQLFDMGVERVIIGTRAVSEFDWFSEMACKFEGRIVLGLDARGAKVATHGWLQNEPNKLMDFAVKASGLPLAAIIYTDIDRDGMLSGPNLERTKELADAVNVPVIAAGGIKELADIQRLIEAGNIEAAITGRALYEGTLDLAEALKLTRKSN